jgi:hypothetical protein
MTRCMRTAGPGEGGGSLVLLCRCGVGAKEGLQGVQSLLPVTLVGAQPGGGGGQRHRFKSTHVLTARDRLPHKTDPFKYLDVFRGGRQRHGQWLGQLTNRQVALGEPAEHVPSGAISERMKNGVHLCRLVNHMAEGIAPLSNRQPFG